MNIGILGTGMVGRTIAAALKELGHSVTMGTRDVSKTRERAVGGKTFGEWLNGHAGIRLATLAETSASGEMIFLCTNGSATLEALNLARPENLKGKTVVDITNPLDFSRGMPPTLLPQFANTTSLGEEIQKALPGASVVKSLNIVNCNVMVNAKKAGGDATMFVAGNDARAKDAVRAILGQFGWMDIFDLGDITGARGMEMFVMLWVRIWATTQNPFFGFKLVRESL